MKAWWISLQTRERMILIIAAAIISIALVYLLLVEPILERRTALTNQVKAQYKTLVWMQQTSQRVQQLRADTNQSKSVNSGQSLLALVENSAKQSNIRKPIQRMEPEGQNGAKLWLEDADFDSLIRWMGELARSQNVVVTRVTISRGNGPGRVNSRLSLQR